MTQQLAMPARCNKCESIFDMSYDFKKYRVKIEEDPLEKEFDEFYDFADENEEMSNLCWECRNDE